MGMWLLERFNTTGCFQTLDLGVKLMKLVVENTPKGHPLQIHWLLDFAAGLGIRHEYTGSSSMDDLYDAIKIYEMVVHTAPAEFHVEARIDRGLVLDNLGNFLGRRFAYSMRAEELDQAIEYLEMATDITLKTDPSRGGRLNSLARWLSERLRYKSNMHDIDRSIELTDEAIRGISEIHPKYAGWLINL
ncbi:hypothetical protein CGCF415_v002605 [Colletotrichum fructicola]|nr:hypothetical protein CGCF415_v002605 [Colletotrichum fructicola]KAF4937706.1 hypothetical protein CGCF245_v005445 [Colletotrichum fructicola]